MNGQGKRWVGLGAALVMGWMGLQAAETPAAAPSEEAAELTVEDLKFCTGVEERQPAGEGTSFPAEVGKLYCWTVIKGAAGEAQVKHQWWLGGEPKAEIALTVRSSRFRTWSSKTIFPGQTGTWTVKVTDAEGKVLKEATVTVGETPEKKG